jgi:hypothetical protein
MRHDFLLATVLVLCPLIFAQQSSSRQTISSERGLRSDMQQGQSPEQDHPHQQPTPEPLPETQPPQNPTPSVPDQRQGATASAPDQASEPIQTFTGLISKEADSYVLKVSASTSYKLDNPRQVQQYEGQRVRVTGKLDASAHLIHVDKVEPLS